MADRPKAGPADDATRRRMLKKRLAEKEPLGLYSRPQDPPKPKPVEATMNPVKNLKNRHRRIDQALEDAGA